MPVKFMTLLYTVYYTLMVMILSIAYFPSSSFASNATDYQAVPPFVTAGVPPLVMLVMGRNHKLYYEAYNDASDLNNDGTLDIGYNPVIEYYGYFDSYKYYEYSHSAHSCLVVIMAFRCHYHLNCSGKSVIYPTY